MKHTMSYVVETEFQPCYIAGKKFPLLNLIMLVQVSKKQTVTSAFIAFGWDQWLQSRGSQIALPVKRGGERGVIQSAWHGAGARVGGHPPDAVLCLVRGQLPTQLLRQDVRLQETHGCLQNQSRKAQKTNVLIRIRGWHLFYFKKGLKAASLMGIDSTTNTRLN